MSKKDKKAKKESSYEDGDLNSSKDDIIDEDSLQEILEGLAEGDPDATKKMKKEFSKHIKMQRLITNRIVNNIFLDYLIQAVITMALICGICGWFNILYAPFYKIVIYAFAFATVDYGIKTLIYEFKPMWVLKSFGTISLLVTIVVMIGLVLPLYFFWDVTLGKTWVVIGCSCLFLIVRTFIITYLKRRKI